MKKVIEEYYCDDCGAKIDMQNGEKHAYITIKHRNSTTEYFLMCVDCLSMRVSHSMSVMPDIKCPACEGEGRISETYSHKEITWHKCSFCNGAKRRDLLK